MWEHRATVPDPVARERTRQVGSNMAAYGRSLPQPHWTALHISSGRHVCRQWLLYCADWKRRWSCHTKDHSHTVLSRTPLFHVQPAPLNMQCWSTRSGSHLCLHVCSDDCCSTRPDYWPSHGTSGGDAQRNPIQLSKIQVISLRRSVAQWFRELRVNTWLSHRGKGLAHDRTTVLPITNFSSWPICRSIWWTLHSGQLSGDTIYHEQFCDTISRCTPELQQSPQLEYVTAVQSGTYTIYVYLSIHHPSPHPDHIHGFIADRQESRVSIESLLFVPLVVKCMRGHGTTKHQCRSWSAGWLHWWSPYPSPLLTLPILNGRIFYSILLCSFNLRAHANYHRILYVGTTLFASKHRPTKWIRCCPFISVQSLFT